MSAIVALAGDAAPPSVEAATRMLASTRVTDVSEIVPLAGAVLGVARRAWECAAHIGGPAAVARDGDMAVVADASLYYRDDLVQALADRGVRPAGATTGHLIAAAYRAWGDECCDRLEGDFAFVLWDGGRRRLLAARDFVGSRSLFYAVAGERLLLGSTLGALLAHPAVSSTLDLVALADTAGVLFADGRETVYEGVKRIGAGERLTREWEQQPRIARYWTPPQFLGEATPVVPFEEAAEELQRLLIAAAEQRVARDGLTAVFMSGGADSPAVFASAREALRRDGAQGRRVEPVSVSFPPGDSGREDEYIQQIADRWESPVHWLPIDRIEMFDRVVERAARREEPFGHPFEMFNRVLAETGVRAGARVALNGLMGDPLFQLSPVYLADLVRGGHPVAAYREWRATGGSGAREFFRWALQPLLPQHALSSASQLARRKPLRGYLERPMAPWIAPEFAKRHALEGRERALRPPRAREPLTSYEARMQLLYPFFPRIYGTVFEIQRDAGLEVRAPLADGRIVRFAASRPRVERQRRGDTKLLLRAAMRGLIPDSVLATRRGKTGTLGSYISRTVQANYDALFDRAFTGSVLAELGIVDEPTLRRRARICAADMANQDGPWIMFTLLTELWLRGHARAGADKHTHVHVGGPPIAHDDRGVGEVTIAAAPE